MTSTENATYEWAVVDEDGIADRYDTAGEARLNLAEYPAGCRVEHVGPVSA